MQNPTMLRHEIGAILAAFCWLGHACTNTDNGHTNGDTDPQPSLCGNGVLDPAEPCDGQLLGSLRCADVSSYRGGTLACNENCTLDTSGCRDPLWGDPCESGEDCPDADALYQTFCDFSTGGYCMQMNGPDFVAEGEPCASDPSSVGIIATGVDYCMHACASDADCRPGYLCIAGLGTTGDLSACVPAWRCLSQGCNDAGATVPYYCDEQGSPDQMCWIDGCFGDPCATDPLSTGTCTRLSDDYACSCTAGAVWDPDAHACWAFECLTNALGTLGPSDPTLAVVGDTCGHRRIYDPGSSGSSCTGWAAEGPEQLYELVLAANTAATIAANPITSFDLSLYVLSACDDLVGADCMVGSDLRNPETVYIANDTNAPATYFVVADGAYAPSCGELDLTIQTSAFTCSATDLGLFAGSQVLADQDGCTNGTSLYNPGLQGCTSNHATGKELLYELEIGAGQSVTVTADPQAANHDVSLYTIDRCGDYGAASCDPSMASDSSAGQTETITIPNNSAETLVVFIVVDSFAAPVNCGVFDLTISAT